MFSITYILERILVLCGVRGIAPVFSGIVTVTLCIMSMGEPVPW